jgi:predicted metal-dependent phosphoesterase TrpH
MGRGNSSENQRLVFCVGSNILAIACKTNCWSSWLRLCPQYSVMSVMKIDLHCHSKYSHDNTLEPEVVIEEAIRKGLHGVCFTEHFSVGASNPVEKIEVPEGFLVFRGVEISTDRGHLLVYGLKDDSWNRWSRNNYLDWAEVIRRVHEQGAICAPAHPFRSWDSLGEDLFEMDGFDAIETHNGHNLEKENLKAIDAARRKNLPSIGGSDCHQRMQVGRAFTVFQNPIIAAEELVREIRLGHCKGVVRGSDA